MPICFCYKLGLIWSEDQLLQRRPIVVTGTTGCYDEHKWLLLRGREEERSLAREKKERKEKQNDVFFFFFFLQWVPIRLILRMIKAIQEYNFRNMIKHGIFVKKVDHFYQKLCFLAHNLEISSSVTTRSLTHLKMLPLAASRFSIAMESMDDRSWTWEIFVCCIPKLGIGTNLPLTT